MIKSVIALLLIFKVSNFLVANEAERYIKNSYLLNDCCSKSKYRILPSKLPFRVKQHVFDGGYQVVIILLGNADILMQEVQRL
ncbi:hypothetical protein HUE58_04880 [Candidatus Ruthia endofausta]|uniref:Uncharacterized protein n=1 Tax=Candidatus Ruthia endofausta TaxID=2738852 RepID=A0A6N0HQ33_9GAMM|nr:hypothetical protein [Candidatus Ruthia endofausta]QKQ24453.1 hypothetical protein HUE58_04880 [Candidatus Ruthia endofausta]